MILGGIWGLFAILLLSLIAFYYKPLEAIVAKIGLFAQCRCPDLNPQIPSWSDGLLATFLCPLCSWRLILHDLSRAGAWVWRSCGTLLLSGHHLCCCHVYLGSHWNLPGKFSALWSMQPKDASLNLVLCHGAVVPSNSHETALISEQMPPALEMSLCHSSD